MLTPALSSSQYAHTQRTNLQKDANADMPTTSNTKHIALIQYKGKMITVEICERSDIDKKSCNKTRVIL